MRVGASTTRRVDALPPVRPAAVAVGWDAVAEAVMSIS
jgi:hypothetical protein